MQDADHVVEFALDHRKTRVGAPDHMGQQLAHRLGDVDHHHLRAGHHDVAGGEFGHLEHALDHRQGFRVEQFALVRGAQQAQQLFTVFGGAKQQR